MFCAPTPMLEPARAALTAMSAGAGGQTASSISVMPWKDARRLCANATPSAAVLYIFQLPAIKGVRMDGVSLLIIEP